MNTPREQNESVEQPKQPSLCANNCGFFSNAACMGYCSKCYREIVKREQKEAAEEASKGSNTDHVKSKGDSSNSKPLPDSKISDNKACKNRIFSSHSSQTSVYVPPTSLSFPVSENMNTTKTNDFWKSEPFIMTESGTKKSLIKCFICRKKIGLTGFTCKCGHIFCGTHRYAELHSCTYDHKAAERAMLERDNPVVQGDKLQRL